MKHEDRTEHSEGAPVDSDQPAFVICNDRGDVFQGWASACSISPSGCEDYYTVPQFGKQKTHVAVGQLVPMGVQYGETYRTGDPHVFSSRRTAEKALARMFGFHRLAIVEVPGVRVSGIRNETGAR